MKQQLEQTNYELARTIFILKEIIEQTKYADENIYPNPNNPDHYLRSMHDAEYIKKLECCEHAKFNRFFKNRTLQQFL
jgi:hypothetical protein